MIVMPNYVLGELSKSEFCKMAHAKFNFELSNNGKLFLKLKKTDIK